MLVTIGLNVNMEKIKMITGKGMEYVIWVGKYSGGVSCRCNGANSFPNET